jgi:hypothetical protein
MADDLRALLREAAGRGTLWVPQPTAWYPCSSVKTRRLVKQIVVGSSPTTCSEKQFGPREFAFARPLSSAVSCDGH